MSNLRIFEIILYSCLNLIPYLGLAIYPFIDKLRFSKKTIYFSFIIFPNITWNICNNLFAKSERTYFLNKYSKLGSVLFYCHKRLFWKTCICASYSIKFC